MGPKAVANSASSGLFASSCAQYIAKMKWVCRGCRSSRACAAGTLVQRVSVARSSASASTAARALSAVRERVAQGLRPVPGTRRESPSAGSSPR